jgi:PKD repeat protein
MTNRLRALWILPVLGLFACGGGGGGGGSSAAPNRSPTANFAFVCSDLACDLTSTSSDEDVGDAITTYTWSFGDGSVGSAAANPSHTFAAGGTYDVSLTVGDRSAATGTIVRKLTVTAPSGSSGPHASFTANCVSLDCVFTDASTYDAGSAFASRVWDFGDTATLAATSPANHSYAATTLTTFIAKLTVTDGGGKTSTSSRSVVVSPPATTLNCVGGGCVLTLSQATRVTATILSHSCSATGNEVVLTAPVNETLFADGCVDPVNTVKLVNGGQTFAAGTVLQFAVRSGFSADASLVFPPSVKVTGSFALGWTLTFDDGYGGAGEPDFNDLVILIKATP